MNTLNWSKSVVSTVSTIVSLVDATTGVVVAAVVDLVEAATVVDLGAATTTGVVVVAVVVFLVETLFLTGVAGIVAEAVVKFIFSKMCDACYVHTTNKSRSISNNDEAKRI